MGQGRLPLYNSEQVIAIGDIHGESTKLMGILNKVTKYLINPKCHLVFTGDYCNRGTNSPKTFEILISLKKEYPNQVFFIRGNHEYMLITTLKGKKDWIKYTSLTLRQLHAYYNLNNDSLKEISLICLEKGIVDFLDNLIPYYENENVILTHAPITMDRPLEEMYFEIMWEFLEDESEKLKSFDKYLICGHQFKKRSNPRIFEHRAFIDTGCGTKWDRPLTAFIYPQKEVIQQY